MSPDLVTPGLVRSAEVVNEDIRKLWSHPAVGLSGEGRAALEQLYEEWAAAKRAEIGRAA